MKIKDIKPRVGENGHVVTGKVRLAFINLLEPRKTNDGTPGKYDCCILIDKKEGKDTIEAINKAIEDATARGIVEKWGNKKPKNMKELLKDGDEREDDQYSGFEGCMYLNAKSKSRPALVDKKLNPILDEDEIYSGMYAIVSLSIYPYAMDANKGVAAGLNNVMKIADGEKMAGKPTAESDFAGIELDDEDDDEDL